MPRIGLVSDTHGFLDSKLLPYLEEVDEIWHAGDIGDLSVLEALEDFKPVKSVYGNIDGGILRQTLPLDLRFECGGMDVWMTHIGGYPGRYNQRIKTTLATDAPDLFICGHSHILKVMYDQKYELLHINPGACGNHGFHKVKTAIRFTIEKGSIKDLEVIELGKRGS